MVAFTTFVLLALQFSVHFRGDAEIELTTAVSTKPL